MSDKNFTYSTNFSQKDSDQENNKNTIEDNFNYINISTNQDQIEMIDFKPPSHKLTWTYFFQNTFHFKQDIERVWMLLRDFEFISLVGNEGQFPCINIKGKGTWKVGNTFKGNLYKIFPYIGRVEKMLNLPEMKSIKWLFNDINDGDYFEIKMNLFKVNEDNSTVALRTIRFQKKEINNELKEKTQGIIKIFNEVEKLLEKETINLLRYESGIIKGKMKDIYDILIDSNKISAIAPNNDIMPNYNLKDLKIGKKTQVSIIKENIVQSADIVLKCREINPNWNKWIIVVEISGGHPKKIPKHISLFQLTKINNYECQLIMMTKYDEPVECKEFHEFTKKKKYLIMSIKDYFEHFYSPEISS